MLLHHSHPASTFIVAGITDIHSGFNGLASKVQNTLKDDPFSGYLFVSQRYTPVVALNLAKLGRRFEAVSELLEPLYFDEQHTRKS
ncbi:hypothetical protein C5470_20540 [Photorhabdus stackebrandtii]|uniref:Uncharacterized protein n=1 Tax=Photorhabdus stackebrandtii TaxID=1123042 RepID=A0A7X5TNP1_9GAMM|nr:hypothetical protein [Photorhabdus stackebrandtii]